MRAKQNLQSKSIIILYIKQRMETHKNQSCNQKKHRFASRIIPIRQQLMHIPQTLGKFDELMNLVQNSMHNNFQAIANYQQSLKNQLATLKVCLYEPQKWLSSLNHQKQSQNILLSKLSITNQMLNAVSVAAFMVKTLAQYKTNPNSMIDFQKLPIPLAKKQLLICYKEAYDYYRCKKCLNNLKDKNKVEQILKINPQISQNEQLKRQMAQLKKEQKLLQRISSKFTQVQQKLIGFNISNKELKDFESIQSRLQKMLEYVNQSYSSKNSQAITPQNIKQQNQIVHLISLFSHSNTGLLKEKINQLSDKPIKQACNKLVQHITKKQRLTQEIYDFLISNIEEKSRYRYLKSIRQLPLDIKLNQIVKIIRQLKKSHIKLSPYKAESGYDKIKMRVRQEKAVEEAVNALQLQTDMKLLIAQEQMYLLQMKCNSNIIQNNQLKQQIQQNKQHHQKQKEQFILKIRMIEEQYNQMVDSNKCLAAQLQQSRIQNIHITTELQGKEIYITQIRQSITSFIHQINQIVQENQKAKVYYKLASKFKIQSKVLDLAILPQNVCMSSLVESFNYTQSINHQQNNNQCRHKEVESMSPIPKRLKRHFRSQSNVDFLSQLMPDAIEDYEEKQVASEVQELKKGIQIRQRTIKKYQAYVDKQRKQAKKNRAQILQLQSRIRNLQLQQIKLKQTIQDQSSEKYLMIEQEGSTYRIQSSQKMEQVGSLQKITEKEVQLKVKEQELNFKIEQIIKHVLKLNTLRVNSQNSNQTEQMENVLQDGPINQESKLQEMQ